MSDARRFEFQDDKSSKFWEIERDGAELTTRWGRIGTKGQTGTKRYTSEAAAEAELDKQVRGKTSKGYVEVGGTQVSAPGKPAASTPASTPAPSKPAASTPAASTPARSTPAAASGDAPTPAAAPTLAASTPAAASGDAPTPANDIPDGGEVSVPGSGGRSYVLRNVGGAYSCTCPAWLHQSAPAERRTCKHLRKFRGDAVEQARLGGALPQRAKISGRPSREGGGSGQATDGKDSKAGADAPPLLLAHRFEDHHDPTGWWLSEKLDGVRAYWDGKQFVSRLGNAYLAPEWFIEGLPDFPLDGELFAGRGRFQHAVSIARRMDRGAGWSSLEFVIFDAPAVDHGFEDRLKHLDDHFGANPWKHAKVLEHRVCEGHDDLQTELRRVEALGGEGVMLRRPGSRYIAGRSDTLLKVKSFLDTEARIIGHQAGTGRHEGRLGALLVELPNGTKFKVGTGLSDAERDAPPDVGEVVIVRYQELTDAGVPRFPSYVGVRADVDWAQLVAAAKR